MANQKEKNPYDKLFDIIEYLKKEKKATPTNISVELKSDIRTTNKMLSTLKRQNMVHVNIFDTGKKKTSVYSLGSKKYGLRYS